MSEVWKPVIGYEGYYEVSTLGRVKSLDRSIRNSVGKGLRLMRGKYLKPAISGRNNGYPQVILSKDGHTVTFDVHILVLTSFIGPCPNGMECRHLDGVRSNSALTNLVWGTPYENQRDRSSHGTSNQGQRNRSAKLTDDDVVAIREKYATGQFSLTALGRQFGVHSPQIAGIVSGVYWSHVGGPRSPIIDRRRKQCVSA